MTTELRAPQWIDDARLAELGGGEARQLFPALRRVPTFWPLVGLLAVLPGLYALEHRALTDSNSLLGLKILEIVTADSFERALDPECAGEIRSVKWNNPLGSWLTASLMKFFGSARPLVLLLVPYFASAGMIVFAYVLGARLFGPRHGFFAAAILALHGPFLSQIQNAAAPGLGVFFALVSIWGFLDHVEESTHLVSFRLLLSGIALGLCVLSGGPLAFGAAGAMFCHVVAGPDDQPPRSKRKSPERSHWQQVWPPLKSLCALYLTAFAVAGWWPLMMLSRYGGEFWQGWFLLQPRQTAASGPMTTGEFAAVTTLRILDLLRVLGGFVGLGLWCAWRDLQIEEAPRKRQRILFLLTWWGCAMVLWLVATGKASAASAALSSWPLFLLIPSILLAVFAFEKCLDRAVPWWLAVAVGLLSLLGYFLDRPTANLLATASAKWFAIAILVTVGIVLVVWNLRSYFLARDPRQTLVLAVVLGTALGANIVDGLTTARVRRDDDRTLEALRRTVTSVDHVAGCAIVGEFPPATQLIYVLRSCWPNAELTISKSWDSAIVPFLSENQDSAGRFIVATWSDKDFRPANLPPEIPVPTPLFAPQYLKSHQLRAWQLVFPVRPPQQFGLRLPR